MKWSPHAEIMPGRDDLLANHHFRDVVVFLRIYAYIYIYKYISNLFVYLYHVFFPNAKQRVPVYNLGVWGLDPCSPPVGMNICCEHEFTNEHVVHVFFNELGKSIDILNWRK